MGLCNFGSDFNRNGFTPVDNVFMDAYLPLADATDVKVYLYGLHLAYLGDLPDNTLERIAFSLRLTEERVIAAFRYWEDQGIVSVSKTHPVRIMYGSVRTPATPVIKYNAKEFSTFVEEMARLFPDTVLSENTLNAYFEVLHQYKMDINAMLMTVRYCIDSRGVPSTQYILAVANNWAKQGIVSESAVTKHIEELECNSEDLWSIFKTLGLRSLPSIEDRQLYLKWTKEYGFRMDAILTAARFCKRRGGWHRLEQMMEELQAAGAISAQEVNEYAKSKESTRSLAEDIIKGIGTYYANYDVVVDTYIQPWLSKGFEEDALRAVAKFCFLRNIRTMDGVNEVVERFYRLGILTQGGVQGFVERQMNIDRQIQEVLAAAGSSSHVSNRDREFYRTFAEVWGFPHQTILLAAAKASGKAFPMSEINRTLALLKERGLREADESESFLNSLPQSTKKSAPRDDYQKQTYTKEQLDSVFVNPGEVDLDTLDF